MGRENPVVAVTGVTRGLGKCLALELSRRGYRTIGLARTSASLEASGLVAHDSRIATEVVDVSDFSAVADAFERIRLKYGSLDVVYNNAALYPRESFPMDSIDDWFDTVRVNLGGVAACCRAALPAMVERGYGRIFNVGSWADIAPIPRSSAYSTSKAGVRALTKSIAADIAHLDVDVEVHEWIPGHLNTRMSEFTGIDPKTSAVWGADLINIKASARCAIFENDKEWLPPKRLKQRLIDALLLRS